MKKESVGKSDFEKVYEECRSAAMTLALLYTGNYDIAEDILQDAFMSYYVCTEFNGVTCRDSLRWIQTAIRNRASNYFRKIKYEKLVGDIDQTIEKICMDVCPENMCVEQFDLMEKIQFAEKILNGLLKKNKQWYEVLVSVYMHEIPEIDIAKNSGINSAALYSKVYRAKQWLRKQYENEYDEIG